MPIGLGLVAAALLLFRSQTTSLWSDEAWTVELVRQPMRAIAHFVWGPEANMALYYLVLGGWLHFANILGLGQGEMIIRLPSVAFAFVACVTVFAIGKRYGGGSVGILSSVLYLLNYEVLMQGAQARSYGLELALSVLSWYALLSAISFSHHRRRWWVIYVALAALGIYAHLFSALVVASQVVAFVALARLPTGWRASVRKCVRAAVVSLLSLSVLVAPIAADAALHGGNNTWVPPAGPYSLVHLVGALVGANPLYLALVCVAAVLGALGLAAPNLGLKAAPEVTVDSKKVALAVVLSAWVLVPVVLSFAMTQPLINFHLFTNRYLVVVVPPMCLLVALVVSSFNNPRLRAVLGTCLVLAALPSLGLYYARVQRQDFRTAAAWVQARHRNGDSVACASWGCAFALGYYLPEEFGANAPGSYSWGTGRANPVDAAALESLANSHRRIFLAYDTIGPNLDPSSVTAERWLDNHLARETEMTTSGSFGVVRVILYRAT